MLRATSIAIAVACLAGSAAPDLAQAQTNGRPVMVSPPSGGGGKDYYSARRLVGAAQKSGTTLRAPYLRYPQPSQARVSPRGGAPAIRMRSRR
jgi:hypothetical protein